MGGRVCPPTLTVLPPHAAQNSIRTSLRLHSPWAGSVVPPPYGTVVIPRDLGREGGAGSWAPLARPSGTGNRARRPCILWRSLESLARRQLFRLLVRAPPAPAMLSALARPAGAALRRSFSTSAQVGPARGWLQAEATCAPSSRAAPTRGPACTAGPPGTGRRLGTLGWSRYRAGSAGQRGEGAPTPEPVHVFESPSSTLPPPPFRGPPEGLLALRLQSFKVEKPGI